MECSLSLSRLSMALQHSSDTGRKTGHQPPGVDVLLLSDDAIFTALRVV